MIPRLRNRFVALVGLAAIAALPATANAATAEIGNLTLAYPEADWAFEGDTIRCISDACAGAIVDITVSENREFCTRDVGYAEAAASFPGADPHAVNTRAIGNLFLVFGQSGPPFNEETGRAFYGCVSRDGLRHEFRARIGDNPIPPYQDGAIFTLLTEGLSAEPHGEMILDLGGLEIAYDGDMFEMVAQSGGPGDGAAMLNCMPPFCREPTPLYANARPLERGGCFPDRPEDTVFPGNFLMGDGNYTEIETGNGGPTVILETVHSMCRAMSPPMLTACVEHEGTRYLMGTFVDLGCYFGPSVPDELFTRFVSGIGLSD